MRDDKEAGALPAEWTAEEIEDLLTDAIGDSFDMDWVARVGAKAIMRELAECGLHITLTDARRDLIANPPKTRECEQSHDGRHHVDTSMESGPSNCFHCERPM